MAQEQLSMEPVADRIRITLRASLESPLHILGPGRTVALVDRPIELDPEHYPFIPASSVRGRIRVHLERLLRTLGQPVCSPPTPQRMCPHLWEEVNRQAAALPESQAAGMVGENFYCMACRIFGSSWHPANLVSDDLRLVAEQRTIQASLLRQERTGLGMSRRLATAEGGRLYSLETSVARTGAPGSSTQGSKIDTRLCFQGTMTGYLTPAEAGWLLAATRSVSHVGGSKARGLGAVELDPVHAAWWHNGAWQETSIETLIEEAL